MAAADRTPRLRAQPAEAQRQSPETRSSPEGHASSPHAHAPSPEGHETTPADARLPSSPSVQAADAQAPGFAARPAFAGKVRSPCISVCRIDPADGLCVGCQRTIDEIADWGAMTPAQRVEVWRLIAERREAKASTQPKVPTR